MTYNKQKTILTFSKNYLPGYKAGGAIRTIANMVEQLSDEFQFNIVTRDRDFEDVKSYDKIKVDAWNKVGKANVFYLSPKNRNINKMKHFLNSTNYDILYLNSFFEPVFTINILVLRRLGLLPKVPLVLAPRGEFSSGALGLKKYKKIGYIIFAKIMGLYKDVIWQASSDYEKKDIRKAFNPEEGIVVAQDVPAIFSKESIICNKVSGYLKIIFLSRISPKKNLAFAISLLKGLKGQIEFNIYGPKGDEKYWNECKQEIKLLNSNVSINYRGTIPNDEVAHVFSNHHLFLFPTLGENFGHVIHESLSAGCPVLISDQTPWRSLMNEGVGWDIPLTEEAKFKEVIQDFIDMNQGQYEAISNKAREYGLSFSNDEEIINKNKKLFNLCMDNNK